MTDVPFPFERIPSLARLHQVALRDNLSVDLLTATPSAGNITVHGLSFRAFNDRLPVALFPEGVLHEKVLPATSIATRRDFFTTASSAINIEVSTAILLGTDDAELKLVIPVIGSNIARTINVEFDRAKADSMVLIEVQEALAYKSQQTSGVWLRADIPTLATLTLQGDGQQDVGIAFRGLSSIYAIGVDAAGGDVLQLTLEKDSNSRIVRLISRKKDSRRGKLRLYVTPVAGERLILGQSSFAFTEAPFMLINYHPLLPGNFHWMVCSVVGNDSFPMALPPIARMRFSVPYLGYALNDGNWVMGRNYPEGGGERLVVILFGDPPVERVDAIIRTQRYGAVYVVTDNRPYATACLEAQQTIGPRDDPGTKWVDADGTRIKFDVFVVDWNDLESVEEILYKIVNEYAFETNLTQLWRSHMENRLPRIPIGTRAQVVPVCVLTNMLRGRLPKHVTSNGNEVSEIIRDDLWLVPWPISPTSYSELVEGIVRRTASEYTAMIAYQDMSTLASSLASPKTSGQKPERNVPMTQHIENWLFRWPWLSADDQRELALAFNSQMRTSGKTPREIISRFAQYIYNMDPEVRYNAGLSFANPMVLLLVAADSYTEVAPLDIDLAFWTTYAGRSSRSRAGLIIPTFTTAQQIDVAKEKFRMLRDIYSAVLNDQNRKVITSTRQEIGALLADILDPSSINVLNHTGADRIVTFADVSLDFLPYGTSVLGMEIPISRYPASAPAMMTVGTAISSATRGQSETRGGPLTRGSAAVVLVASEATDLQTIWSRELAESMDKALRWVGLLTKTPETEGRLDEALHEASNSAVVMFFGHASAGGGSATLDLGRTSITVKDIEGQRWDGCFVSLIGCETSAVDAPERDLALAFLRGGARAVIGTSAKGVCCCG